MQTWAEGGLGEDWGSKVGSLGKEGKWGSRLLYGRRSDSSSGKSWISILRWGSLVSSTGPQNIHLPTPMAWPLCLLWTIHIISKGCGSKVAAVQVKMYPIWPGRLGLLVVIKGDINRCPNYLKINSTLGGPVNPKHGPFNFTEYLEMILGKRIIIVLPNCRGLKFIKIL